jgi:hypothetical protein
MTTCPNCFKVYTPVLGSRKHPELLIQEEFPDAKPWQREQLQTGICSDACWDEYLGVPNPRKRKLEDGIPGLPELF